MKNKLINFLKSGLDFAFTLLVVCGATWALFLLFGLSISDFLENEKTRKVLDLLSKLSHGSRYVGYLYLIPVAVVFFPVYSLIIFITKWGRIKYLSKGKIGSAEEYVKKKTSSDEEYCLILRSFGNDGYFSINNVSSTYMFDSLVTNWTKGIILEQWIEGSVTKHGNCETVALVDPNAKFVPISPKFIATRNETWQQVIFDLLKRALFVFIVLPPKQNIRDSLVWEIKKLIQLGMTERFLIIIPPQKFGDNKRMIREIRSKLYFLGDNMDAINDASFLLYPTKKKGVICFHNGWHELSKKEQAEYSEVFPLPEYFKKVEELLELMFTGISRYSFNQRYIYKDYEFADFDDSL